MKTKHLFPIRFVARQTGLSAHLIRVWEKRYQAVLPDRTDSNQRRYSEGDVLRLQLLKKAVEAGHSISQVANLASEELMRLINLGPTSILETSSIGERRTLNKSYFYDLSLSAAANLDVTGLEVALEQAAVHLTRPELLEAVVAPLCQKIGELWKQGDLKVITEHLATPVIRAFLWDLLRSTQVPETAPKIVISTPAGQLHELGALTVALIACESGWRPLYFGPNLPAEEIAAAVAYTEARAVALSITIRKDNHLLGLELKKLRRYLSGDISILIGGQGALTVADLSALTGIQVLADTTGFRLALDRLIDSQ